MFHTRRAYALLKTVIMKLAAGLSALLWLSLSLWSTAAQTPVELLKTRAELTNYQETSRYEDVLRFFDELQKRSPFVRVEIFGRSQEGRALPLIILSDPPVAQPREAMASGKPVVFVMANIHAGEVEGKEAVQDLAQRILTGDLRPLLGKLIILIAPDYNADGNERISVDNRADQNGPVGGVGVRENAQGLDLNRDYMKLEAPESRALVNLFNRWDPHLTVDLHTTDGSYHAYHLTYSPMLNPDADPRLIDYERGQMLPAITKAMLKQHRFRTYYYGNFATNTSSRELNRPIETKAGRPAASNIWRTFDHRPRFGNNYVGLRNRLTILSEAYSHLDFRGRVEVTEAFVEEIFKYAAAHGKEIRQLTRRADEDTIQRGLTGKPFQFGVEFEMKPLPKPVEILVGDVTKLKNPRSGSDMTAMVENALRPVKMPDYGVFEATRSVPMPGAYLFHREDGLRTVLEKLQAHGIAVEELTAPLTAEVESFMIGSVKKASRRFQGHNEVKLSGEYKTETITFPAGTVLVRAAQPFGTLAAYLLEPESDDGLAAWNFLDAYLKPGQTYPICKLMRSAEVASRLIEAEQLNAPARGKPNPDTTN